MAADQGHAEARQSSLGETLGRPGRPGRPGAGRTAGLLMGLAAVTLGVASYLHRDGHIQLGFTVINGERFSAASVPEAVIGFVLAIGAMAALADWHRARPLAWGTTIFAILGVAYGLSDTAGTGRVIDIAYHSALMTVLLTTAIVLWRRRGRAGDGSVQNR
ncbi:MAG: hypothetical protein ACRDRJ_29690 [Streptosporangiaceae bacterium]